MLAALKAIIFRQGHVVTKVIEAVFVVGSIGDICRVRGLLVPMWHARIDDPDRQTQPVVDLTHPGGVTLGEVVVDGDDMNTFTFQRVQIYRQGGDQRLAFTRAHLSDATRVQYHATDQLYVVVAHAKHALCRFSHGGKCLGQQLIHFFATSNALFVLGGFCLQRVVTQCLHLCFERIDSHNGLGELFDQTLIAAAKDAGEKRVEHGLFQKSESERAST